MKIDLKAMIDATRRKQNEEILSDIDNILKNRATEAVIIFPLRIGISFQQHFKDKVISQKYHISGIYDLGTCEKIPLELVHPKLKGKWFIEDYCLYTLCLKRPKTIKIFSAKKIIY